VPPGGAPFKKKPASKVFGKAGGQAPLGKKKKKKKKHIYGHEKGQLVGREFGEGEVNFLPRNFF